MFTGYLVERRKIGLKRWIKCNVEPCLENQMVVKRLIEGVDYEVRAIAINKIGMGLPSEASLPFTPLGMLKTTLLTSEVLQIYTLIF